MVCSQFTGSGQTATRDGSNLNCLLAAKQSEHWPVLREIWKVEICFSHKNLASKKSTSTPATTQVCNSLGWCNWTMLHPMGQNLVHLKLYPLPVHGLFAQFCPTTLKPANWTLKIDVTVLHFDGTIANYKETGLGHFLASWLQEDVFTLPS